MNKYFCVVITVSIVFFSTFPVLAMDEQRHDKLSIIAEVNPRTRNLINQCFKTDAATILLPKNGTVKLARYPKNSYHISLDCFNHNHPTDTTLHVQFGKAEENYLYRIMTRFANHPQRQQEGPYNGACYDIQLWCHIKTSEGQHKQHFHFSMIDRAADGVFHIDKLPQIMDQVDYAHLVLRVGTKGTFSGDWNKIVHGINPQTGKSAGGIFCNQEQEVKQLGKREMTPYRIVSKLTPHITVARLEKPQGNGKTLAFSGSEDLELLKNIYKSVASQYVAPPITIDTLRVTTRRNKQMEYLGEPQKL